MKLISLVGRTSSPSALNFSDGLEVRRTPEFSRRTRENCAVRPVSEARRFPTKTFRFGETSQRFTDSPLLMLASGATDDYHQWFVPPSFEGGMAFYLTTLPHERHL